MIPVGNNSTEYDNGYFRRICLCIRISGCIDICEQSICISVVDITYTYDRSDRGYINKRELHIF
jgi:hypothetical protein